MLEKTRIQEWKKKKKERKRKKTPNWNLWKFKTN